jgi:hypothetical protein
VLHKVGQRLFEVGLTLDTIEGSFVVWSDCAFASDEGSVVEEEVGVEDCREEGFFTANLHGCNLRAVLFDRTHPANPFFLALYSLTSSLVDLNAAEGLWLMMIVFLSDDVPDQSVKQTFLTLYQLFHKVLVTDLHALATTPYHLDGS